MEEGLRILAMIRKEYGFPVLTDIHESVQVPAVAAAVDVLQIPAFLCRQTDLIHAAGASGRNVNIKKGQWMAPEQMAGAVEKARSAGAAGVAVTERGTFFGYGDLVVDMRSFQRLRAATGAPAIFDGTHSVQRPGLANGASGGDPEYSRPLVLAAMAAGADALFLEVHPDPANAPSDGRNMLRLDRLRPLLLEVLDLRAALCRHHAAAPVIPATSRAPAA
jgi:2-dehydro-3-deoxyphosphooctonate aldolase (KDO 8-P synthase)